MSLFPVDALKGSIWGYISCLKVTVRNGIRLVTAPLKKYMHLYIRIYTWKLFKFEGFSISVSQRETKHQESSSFRRYRKKK